MNHQVFQRFSLGLRLAATIFCPTVGFHAPAEPAPQFAFSISSNQIPGGIWPTAIGTDLSGKVYISSLWNVIKVDTNGAELRWWGTQGTGPGQFTYAGQTAFDRPGSVYILDAYNSRLEQFDTNGDLIATWGTYGSGPGQFDQPDGLAVLPSGRIYVSDSLNFRIQVFAPGGSFLKEFGTIGTNEGQFSFPGVIAVDSSNNLYVVDSPGGSFDNYRIQKFDSEGHFLKQWGSYGLNSNTMIQIGGITTDKANNVYVADGANNWIQKFTSDGVFLSQWGSPGNGPGQFNTPSGISIDPTGNYVYVGDYYNGRVNVFAYEALNPLLYQPPTNRIVPIGVDMSLDAGVFGAQPFTYEWFFNGAPVPGGTGASLVISNVPQSAAGTYSVSASNWLGAVSSDSASVMVLPAVVNTLAVGGISATGAVLNGSAWVGSAPTSVWFEWGTNSSYGQTTGLTNINPHTTAGLSVRLGNLIGDAMYHYRVVGSNTFGVVYGLDTTFQIGLKPTIRTMPITAIDSQSVFLNALVNPEARDTSVFFRWGRYNANQYNSPTNILPPFSTTTNVQTIVTGLVSGVLYAYQPVASNALGIVMGSIMSFVAPPWVLLPAPSGNVWSSIASSADGSRLTAIANGRIYVSPDAGLTWVSNAPQTENWNSAAISADGSHLLAGAGLTVPGPAFVSTNFGQSWLKANSPDRHWSALASSGDGSRVAAVDPTSQLVLTSTNGGLNWQTNSPPIAAMWSTVASSADGRRLIVAAGGVDRTTNGPVYTSTDSGVSWVSNSLPVSYWRSVASSANGQILLAAVGGLHAGAVYISTNAGASWSVTSAPQTNWQSVAVSADGGTIAVVARLSPNPLFISTNLGASWQSYALPQAIWSALALSADGAKVFASADQNIFTLQRAPTPNIRADFGPQGLSLSWVIPSEPVLVQHSDDLSSSQWTNLSASPIVNLTNLTYRVLLPKGGQSGFYRLKMTVAPP